MVYAKLIGVKFGKKCKFIRPVFGTEPYLINIGDHVEITNGVRFNTHDGSVWIFREKNPSIEIFEPINIGSNVFIGINAIIMPGVSIGDNCIIGSGAIVTKNIPPNSLAVGVPAKVIKTSDEYFKSIQGKAFDIRHLTPQEKKLNLLDHFGMG